MLGPPVSGAVPHLVEAGATLVPSAWPYPRVEHWCLLSRTVENQLYVAAANGVGRFEEAELLGRSTVYDPWGTALARSDDDPRSSPRPSLRRQSSRFARSSPRSPTAGGDRPRLFYPWTPTVHRRHGAFHVDAGYLARLAARPHGVARPPKAVRTAFHRSSSAAPFVAQPVIPPALEPMPPATVHSSVLISADSPGAIRISVALLSVQAVRSVTAWTTSPCG